jgi:hypothetical protein
MWRSASTSQTSDMIPYSRGMPPEFCLTVSPQKQRAQGMPGVRCTRGPCAKNSTRSSPQVHRHHTGIPCAMVLTIYSVLSPATNSSCHRHRRIDGFAGPGRAGKTSADLTPATGARTTRLHRPRPVFAKRLCRSVHIRPSFGEAEAAPFVCTPSIAHRPRACPATTLARPTLPRPPHPVPTFVTMANAPLAGQDGERKPLIWG